MPISKITINGEILLDISCDTVKKETLLNQESAHSSDGRIIEGSMLSRDNTGFYVDQNGIMYASPPPFRLRVMTYNAGSWYQGLHENVPAEKYNDYLDLQRGIINSQKPDIAVFQEYWRYFDQNKTTTAIDLLGYYFGDIYQHNPDSESWGQTIASKSFPLDEKTYHPFRSNTEIWNPDNDSKYYYGYQKSYITINGKRIAIFNTWVTEYADGNSDPEISQRYRIYESSELLEAVSEEEYFILLGDFNVECYININPNNPNYEVGSDSYLYILRKFVDKGYNLCNNYVDNIAPSLNDWSEGFLNASGNLQRQSNGPDLEITSPFIPVVPYTEYTFIYSLDNTPNHYWSALCFYDSDKNLIGTRKTNGSSQNYYNLIYSAPSSAAYARVSFSTFGNARMARFGQFRSINTYFRPNGNASPLDQIITSSNIVVENAFIDTSKFTDYSTNHYNIYGDRIDHVPFFADLIIN